jgi:hypothetical protein
VLVEQGALPAGEDAFRARRSVDIDLFHGEAAELTRQRARIADRRAREAKRRVRAVVLAQTSEPAQHVRDVTSEDAALGVELVDHDVTQPEQEGRPPVVTREDAHVQHLGIREHDVRVRADPGPLVGGGGTVVGTAHAGDEPRPQR